jgi:hypothetical protein
VMKCQLQCGPELERSTPTPTRNTHLASAFSMLTSVKTCQSEGGATLELDNKGTPSTVAPESSDSERNISLADTSQSQGGGPDLGRSMTTPTLGDPLSSALAMSTPVKTCPPHILSVSTCQSAGGAGHERDSTDAPPPAAPWSERESVLKGDIPPLPATAYFGYAVAVNGDTTFSCPSPPHLATGDFGDLGAAYPALQHSTSILTTQVCPSRCLLHFLLLISSRAPTFCPRRTYHDVGGVSDDRGNPVRTDLPRVSKEHGMLRDKSQSAIFHRADRQPQTMRRREDPVDWRGVVYDNIT